MFLTRQEIRRAAGHAVMCGFSGTHLGPELREIMREVRPLGLVWFARNVESAEQVAELGAELKAAADGPLLLAVDQEGGRVARIGAPATAWPPLRHLGARGAAAAPMAQAFGAALAAEMRSLNIDVDFAPVLDVDTNPQNPIIGARAFSADPEICAALGAAFVTGMQAAGVGACGKHFPGHGDTHVDSHLDLPTVDHGPDRLAACEYLPFRAAIAAGVGAIMTAHVVVAGVDAQPATLSRRILTGDLRGTLGFGGAIVSDDIEMRAVAARHTPEALGPLGLNAGVDVFLACNRYEVTLALYRGLVLGAESGAIAHADLAAAAGRARAWQQRFAQPPVRRGQWRHVLGSPAHQALSATLTER